MTGRERALQLGAMLQCAPIEDEFEYRFGFDVTANTFLNRLIPKSLMDHKLPLTPGQYFRSLAVLTYATRVLFETDRLLANLALIAETLQKTQPKATLSLELLVTEIGLLASEDGVDAAAAHARFQQLGGPACACDVTAVEPYFEAVGFMLSDQLGADPLGPVSHKGAFLAAVFAASAVPHIGEEAESVQQHRKRGAHWEGSTTALTALAKRVTLADLEAHLTGNPRARGGS